MWNDEESTEQPPASNENETHERALQSPAQEGTRKLYVPASSRPERQPAVEPSQAAVLFDIVYAASISHHAMTVSNAPPAATSATMLIYLSSPLLTE